MPFLPGPPVVVPFLTPILVGRVLLKETTEEKGTVIRTSLLEDLGYILHFTGDSIYPKCKVYPVTSLIYPVTHFVLPVYILPVTQIEAKNRNIHFITGPNSIHAGPQLANLQMGHQVLFYFGVLGASMLNRPEVPFLGWV